MLYAQKMKALLFFFAIFIIIYVFLTILDLIERIKKPIDTISNAILTTASANKEASYNIPNIMLPKNQLSPNTPSNNPKPKDLLSLEVSFATADFSIDS